MFTEAESFSHDGTLVDYHLIWNPPANINWTDVSHYILMDGIKNTSVHPSLTELVYETNIDTKYLKMLAVDRCNREGNSTLEELSIASIASKATVSISLYVLLVVPLYF